MNILILISTLEYGGAEKQAILDAELLSKDNNVFLCTFSSGPLAKIIPKQVTYSIITKKGYFQAAYEVYKYAKRNKVEVIHASLFASMIISVLASFGLNLSVFWHFHSHEYNIPTRSKLAFFFLSFAPSLKKILFVNRELLDYYKCRYYFPRHKLKVLFNFSSIHINRLTKLSFGDIIIGYVGRLVELKRLEYLIEMAVFFRDNGFNKFKIIIVGDGEKRKSLESYSKKLKVDEFIFFSGFQNNLEEWYSKFHIFVNPSSEECLSMALIDAGMAGIPAIAFDVGGNKEIILSGKTGFIVTSKEELFSITGNLLNDDKLRDRMGAKASKFCADRFSPHSHFESLMQLYGECFGTLSKVS